MGDLCILNNNDKLETVEKAVSYDQKTRAYAQENALRADKIIEYGPHKQQRIELFFPKIREKDLPILVFLHGGAWIAGNIDWLRFMADPVIRQPAIFAAVSYRLAPECRWPSQLNDFELAFNSLFPALKKHGGDTNKIVVGGHSAGGQIAAMAVLTEKISPVLACMLVSSPLDLRYDRVPSDTGAGRVYQYLLERPEDDTDASPITRIKKNSVPFHLTWGSEDFVRIADSNTRMMQAMREEGQHVEYRIHTGADHFDTHLALRDPNNDWYATFRRFVANDYSFELSLKR